MRSFNAAADFSRTIAFALAAFAVVLLPLLLLRAFGMDWTAALRDAAMSNGPEAGLISNAGIVLMAIGALTSAFAWAVTRSPHLLALALFCFAFAADDALMLHERLGNHEFLAYAAYGLGFALVWRLLATSHGTGVLWPVVLVLVAFAASVAFDEIGGLLRSVVPASWHDRVHHLLYGLEDIPKTVGIMCLSLVAVNEALDAMQARKLRAGGAPQW